MQIIHTAPVDRRLAGAFIRTFMPRMPSPPRAATSCEDFAAVLRRAPPSAPGPDGLPYSARCNAGPAAIAALHSLHMHIASRRCTSSLRGLCGSFLPKGSAAGDSERSGRRDRRASGTRPLALCNTDRKAAAGVINGPRRHQLREHSPISQCGFIQGRTTTMQLIALETAARCETARAMARAMEDGWLPQDPPTHPLSLARKHRWRTLEPQAGAQVDVAIKRNRTGGTSEHCWEEQRHESQGEQGVTAETHLIDLIGIATGMQGKADEPTTTRATPQNDPHRQLRTDMADPLLDTIPCI